MNRLKERIETIWSVHKSLCNNKYLQWRRFCFYTALNKDYHPTKKKKAEKILRGNVITYTFSS